jgi:diguanylate cyclase (GGDEF)-like protein/putative nucleotidyltransferase with HDIG domain
LLWVGAVIVLGFNALLALWLVVRPASNGKVVATDDIMQTAGPLLGVVLYFFLSRRLLDRQSDPARDHGKRNPHYWSPTLLALGALSFAVGQAIWAYYELVINRATPFPSLSDVGYLSAYPFFFLGVLLLPIRRTSLTARTRVMLDGTLIMAAVVTFSWYYVLGPTLIQGGETLLAKAVGTAYPVCDLALVFCLLLLAGRSMSGPWRLSIRILSVGLGAIVVTDAVFDYETLHGTYATGGLIDLGWPLGYMLICLGAVAAQVAMSGQQRNADVARRQRAEATPRSPLPAWYSVAPYVLVPLIGALMVYVGHVPGDPAVDPGVYIGGAVLIGAVLVRQIVIILENRQLYRETAENADRLRAAQDELRTNNQALAEANARLEELATTDLLTGLPNHRALVAALDHELERAHRYNRAFSLLFIDIDHFKALNDLYGHAVGDDALRGFAAAARAALRGSDIVGRWGGEEFVAILPETEPEGATEVAERLRAHASDNALPLASEHRLTCSVGISHFPEDAVDRNALLEMADRAMYAAKRLGRNQVRLSTEPAVVALTRTVAKPGTREEGTLIGTAEALAALVQARDRSTGHHAAEVADLSARLGEWLGLEPSEVYRLRLAAWLHDIGKVAIPDAVLQKPARLSGEEWELIRTHTVVGADVVHHLPGLRTLAPVIRGHHERWDGAGYPDGLAGEEIPLAARIIAVVDAYLTIVTDRPYRHARGVEEARAEIRRCSGSQFDPTVVEALEALLERDSRLLRAV